MPTFPALRRVLLVAAIAGLAGCGMMPSKDRASFGATLSGAAEVPPNDSAGSGNARVEFDKASNVLRWTVTYAGLTGPATAGHIHGPAMPGQNAGVVVPFKGGVASPIQGEATLTPEQVADLMAGRWYVNLHTAAHPGGEIRGQLTPM
ncbi:MAG TPA: CHRD domain-containing protein [Burkholderiaceae bacterium]